MSEMNDINFDAESRIVGDDSATRNAKVKVFGVGGAGGNTVNRMKRMNIEGVEYYAVNTDSMAIDQSLADHKILIGEKSTKNLGAGMDPERGRKAVEENVEEIREAMKGADMVFVTAGMGGGTGTGAAPVVASIAREMGILTVAVVTKPFRFEGNARSRVAQQGIAALREAVDTIIVVENKKLLTLLQASNQKATMDEAFRMADEILGNAVQSICGIMFHHGLVHVDFADIRKVMQNGGSALMGTGCAQGEKRGIAAADLALSSPLLEDISIEGATGVLINVAHGENYSLLEHSEAMEHIYEKVGEEGDPNIIIGDITLPDLGDKVYITIIATGCGGVTAAPVEQGKNATGFVPTPFGNQNQTAAVRNNFQQTQAVKPAVAPTVKATPRPTGLNFFDFTQQQATVQASQPVQQAPVAPKQEMFTRQAPAQRVANVAAAAQVAAPDVATITMPRLTDSQTFPTVDSGMYNSNAFNAQQPVEEQVVSGTETAEISALSDEDEYNGGHGNNVNIPAFLRQAPAAAAEQPAVTARTVPHQEAVVENMMKNDSVDYSMPAFLRNGGCDMDNF